MTPKMWVVESDPTQDIALFVIAPSLFDSVNPWTVTATLGTDTASDTVIIDSNKEYEVTLIYRQYIIKNGRFQNGYSFPSSLRLDHPPSITENYNGSGYLRMGMVNSWSTGGVTDSIDIAAYQNLCAEAYKDNGSAYVGIWSGYNYTSQSAIESTAVAKTEVQGTSSLLVVDISSLTGSYYIGGSIGHSSNNYYLFIADMWLE